MGSPPAVLSVVGSDPSGGPGIQADLRTFAAYGVYVMAALTTVTVGNTRGVKRAFDLPAEGAPAMIDPANRRVAVLTAIALFLVTGAVNLQVPLYPVYAAAAGYGTGGTAVVFAAYVAGLLPTLILLGGLSDRLGRRPVILIGLGCAAAATALVWASPTMQSLTLARLFQGIGVGLSVGAGTAYLADLLGAAVGPARAAAYTAATTSLGFGSGALLTSTALLAGSSMRPVSYPGAFVLLVACGLGLALSPRPEPWEERTAPGFASRPSLLRLPAFPRGSIFAGLAIALAWTVSGLVIAVVPSQLRAFGLAAWAGPVLFAVNGTGVIAQPHARRLSALGALRHGFVLLPVGYSLLALGAWKGWLPLVLVGAAVAGAASYGYTYLGGLTEVSRLGGADRARAVSGYFLWAYIGFSVPSIAVGYLGDAIGIAAALGVFGTVVGGLSAMLYRWSMQRESRGV